MNNFKLKTIDWIILTVSILSYLSINIKSPFYINSHDIIINYFYNKIPNISNIISFSISIFLLLKSNYLLNKEKNISEYILFMFLFINPLYWDIICIPIENISFCFSIFLATVVYKNMRKNNFYNPPLYILFVIFNIQFITFFCILLSLDSFIYNDNKIKNNRAYFGIFLFSTISIIINILLLFPGNNDYFSEKIAISITNTISLFYSLWGFLLIFSIIGTLIHIFRKDFIKNINVINILTSLILISFVSIVSFYEFKVFPIYIIIFIGLFYLMKYIPRISKILVIISFIFSFSSFYAISDNHFKNRQFIENIINHISLVNKQYHLKYIIGNLPESKEVTNYNFLIKNHSESENLYFKNILYKNNVYANVLTYKQNNLNIDIHKDKIILDFKYFYVYKHTDFYYLYIKKVIK